MRSDLLPYFGLPFYRAMLERSGFEDDIAAYDEAAGKRRRRGHAGGDLRRASCDALTAVGDADAVRAGVARYARGGRDSPCVGPVPRTDFEATLRAAAPG